MRTYRNDGEFKEPIDLTMNFANNTETGYRLFAEGENYTSNIFAVYRNTITKETNGIVPRVMTSAVIVSSVGAPRDRGRQKHEPT